MHISAKRLFFIAICIACVGSNATAQKSRAPAATGRIPDNVLLQIIRAEDERRWDENLKSLLSHPDAKIRKRAALATGRIGDSEAVPMLIELLMMDRDAAVQQTAAFALGEIESAGAACSLIRDVKDPARPGRARALEALGKVTATLAATTPTPAKDAAQPVDDRLDALTAEIVGALRFEHNRRANPDRLMVLLGLTAALRTKPEASGGLIKNFLTFDDPGIVAAALNTLARLRWKDGNEQARRLLVKHSDPIVRANAARVLGATEDKQAFDALLDRALNDSDLRVRVSSIRALGGLKDGRSGDPLLDRGIALTGAAEKEQGEALNEILEIATALGLIWPNTNSQKAVDWLSKIRELNERTFAPVEIAFARIAPQLYSMATYALKTRPATQAQGLAELATIKTGQPLLDAGNKEAASIFLRNAINCPLKKTSSRSARVRPQPGKLGAVGSRCRPLGPITLPDYLRAYAAFKPTGLEEMLRPYLNDQDVIVRATAAGLLGEQTPSETNTRALIQALPAAFRDKDNDAALAILDALAKQKTKQADEAIKTALESRDHLLRRRAVALLKANGAGDFSNQIGTVQTRNSIVDYRRAIARIGKKVTATVVTNKGSFTIELLPEDAPLTVDNFVQLARKGYFNGQTVPRVVPNFVIQTGDPRGDQNGGPGYQIRCEINEVPYERGAVGMALSGKDTGGSQWFVTHSPQPHLDGGYTVFGRVIAGMDVVDRIARGDTIRRVVVNER